MKTIVFVTSAMGRGGAERVISILAEHYRKKGYKVYIVMLWHNIVGYELHSDIEIVDMSLEGGITLKNLPKQIKNLKKFLKELKPQVVLSFIYINNVVTYFATKRLNLRFIPSERNDPSLEKRNFLLRYLINKSYTKSNITIQQTERSKNYFPKKVRKNSVVIPNPISVKTVVQDKREKLVVTAGRLEPQKNHKMLINAFAKFNKIHPDFKLIIYGEGSLREELENQIQTLGLTERVLLPGNVENIHEKMSNALIFALSSDFEGLSNALLEAMMMGLTCVSTNCAGADEAIENGVNGILVPIKDEEAFSKCLCELAENEEYCLSLGEKARETSQRYSFDNVLSLWDAVVEVEE